MLCLTPSRRFASHHESTFVCLTGDFDCSNTDVGTQGNQCDGTSPFPNVDTKTLDVFSVVQGESGSGVFDDDTFKESAQDDSPMDDATSETEDGTSRGWSAYVNMCSVVLGSLVGLAALLP